MSARAAIAGVLALALAARLWATGQGYPEFYGHVDEVGVAASIWNFFRAGTLRPTEFTYPALYQYLVAAALAAGYGLGLVPRAGGLVDSLVLLSYLDPAWSALVGRGLSALLSTLCVWLTYCLGREALSRRTGLIAALFACLALVPVEQAHRALPDSAMALWAALCFYLAWKVYLRGRWRDYAGAGVAAGLVVATKYNGAFAALALVAAHLARGRERGAGWRTLVAPRLWGAVAVAFAALLAGSPYLLLARRQYLALARYQVSSLGFALEKTQPWWWIGRNLVLHEGLIGALMVGAVGWALYRRKVLDWLFLAAWIPSFLYIGSWTRQSLHYLLHFYPLLALGAARLLEALARRLAGESGRVRMVWILAGVCALPSLYRLVQYERALLRPPVRALAAQWIEAQVPAGTKIAMTWLPYCPRLALESARRSIRRYYEGKPQIQARLARQWGAHPAYRLVNLEVRLKRPFVPQQYRHRVELDDPETRRVFSRVWRPVGQLRSMGVKYIVLPEAVYERYLRAEPPPPGTAAHYHYLKNYTYFARLTAADNPEIEEVAAFAAGEKARGGAIRIFRLR